MITESMYWKEDIKKISGRFKKRQYQKRWSARSLTNVEKDIFFAFYAIRKLIEASKLSETILNLKLSVTAYPFNGEYITKLNWHRIDKHYNFDNEFHENLAIRFVCNQIIHSYLFGTLCDEENRLEGIYFSSDRDKHQKLYHIRLADLILCFDKVSDDDISDAEFIYNVDNHDYDVTLTKSNLKDD